MAENLENLELRLKENKIKEIELKLKIAEVKLLYSCRKLERANKKISKAKEKIRNIKLKLEEEEESETEEEVVKRNLKAIKQIKLNEVKLYHFMNPEDKKYREWLWEIGLGHLR